MILGIGLDMAEIPRMQRLHARFGPRFARRILHPLELGAIPPAPAAFLASRFAAKEAAVKALGTGFTGEINFQSFCVRKMGMGRPELLLYGAALECFTKMGARRCLLSLTHSRENAVAVGILE